MAGLRAYAVAVDELRAVVGASGEHAAHLRTLVGRAFAPPFGPPAGPGPLGPLYRRVPGTALLHPDDPTPADLDVLLAGRGVPTARAAATWRLLEAAATGLAWATTHVTDAKLPVGLLAPVDLPVPAVAGLTVAWCPLETAAAVPGLRAWLAGSDAWTAAAGRAGRPVPDVVVFRR